MITRLFTTATASSFATRLGSCAVTSSSSATPHWTARATHSSSSSSNTNNKKMSSITVGDLKYIKAPQLKDLIQEQQKQGKPDSVVVVDVRDDDYLGGHIRSSLHFPSHNHDVMWPTLRRKLEPASLVVFHCMYSSQRGPTAALRYLRDLESRGKLEGGKQEVKVLEGGWMSWQSRYGGDESLTEGYRRELWEEEED